MQNHDKIFNYIFDRQFGTCMLQVEPNSLDYNKWFSYGFIKKRTAEIINYPGIWFETEKYNITDLHHRAHKTKWRLKKFPLFINSMLNLIGLNNNAHLQYGSRFKITDEKAERYERFLERHPKMARFVNGDV